MSLKDDILWGDEVYSPLTLRSSLEKHFPLILLISKGRQGLLDVDGKFSDQVARVKTISRQERILARNAKGEVLSFPANFPIKMHVIGSKKSSKTMKEILRKNKKPVQVQFDYKKKWTFHVNGEPYTTENFGFFFLYGIYLEAFLVCNVIRRDQVDKHQTLLPLGVDVKLLVGRGLKSGNAREWSNFQNHYTMLAQKVAFKEEPGTKAIFRVDQGNPVLTKFKLPSDFHRTLSKQLSAPMGTTADVRINGNNLGMVGNNQYSETTIVKSINNDMASGHMDSNRENIDPLYAAPIKKAQRGLSQETEVKKVGSYRIDDNDDVNDEGPSVKKQEAIAQATETRVTTTTVTSVTRNQTEEQEIRKGLSGADVGMSEGTSATENIVKTSTVVSSQAEDTTPGISESVQASKRASSSSRSSSDSSSSSKSTIHVEIPEKKEISDDLGSLVAAKTALETRANGADTPVMSLTQDREYEATQPASGPSVPQVFSTAVPVLLDEKKEYASSDIVRQNHHEDNFEDHVTYNASTTYHTMPRRIYHKGIAYEPVPSRQQDENLRIKTNGVYDEKRILLNASEDMYMHNSLPRRQVDDAYVESQRNSQSLKRPPVGEYPQGRAGHLEEKRYGHAYLSGGSLRTDYGSSSLPTRRGKIPTFHKSEDFIPNQRDDAALTMMQYPPDIYRMPYVKKAASLSGLSVASEESVSLIDIGPDDLPDQGTWYDDRNKILDAAPQNTTGTRASAELYKSHIYLAPIGESEIDNLDEYPEATNSLDYVDAKPVYSETRVHSRVQPKHSAETYSRLEETNIRSSAVGPVNIDTSHRNDHSRILTADVIRSQSPPRQDPLSPASGDLVISTRRGSKVIQQDYIKGDNRRHSPERRDDFNRYSDEEYFVEDRSPREERDSHKRKHKYYQDEVTYSRSYADDASGKNRSRQNRHPKMTNDLDTVDNEALYEEPQHIVTRYGSTKSQHNRHHDAHRDRQDGRSKSTRPRPSNRDLEETYFESSRNYHKDFAPDHNANRRSHAARKQRHSVQYRTEYDEPQIHDYSSLHPSRRGTESDSLGLDDVSDEEEHNTSPVKMKQANKHGVQSTSRESDEEVSFDYEEDLSRDLGSRAESDEENPYAELSDIELIRTGKSRKWKSNKSGMRHRPSMPAYRAPAPPPGPPVLPPMRDQKNSFNDQTSINASRSDSNDEGNMGQLFGGIMSDLKEKALMEMNKISSDRIQRSNDQVYEQPVVMREGSNDIPKLPTSAKDKSNKGKKKSGKSSEATTALISSIHTAGFTGSENDNHSQWPMNQTASRTNYLPDAPKETQQGIAAADRFASSSHSRMYPVVDVSPRQSSNQYHSQSNYKYGDYGSSSIAASSRVVSTSAQVNSSSIHGGRANTSVGSRAFLTSNSEPATMESFHDSIRDLDDYLHEQDPDSVSISSIASLRYKNVLAYNVSEGATQL